MAESFVFHDRWRNVLGELPPQVRLEVYDAIMEYGLSGTLNELKATAKLAFTIIKNEIDADNQKTEDIRRKRSEAGKKGGAPKGNANALKQAKQAKQANACIENCKPLETSVNTGVLEEQAKQANACIGGKSELIKEKEIPFPLASPILKEKENNLPMSTPVHTCEEVVEYYNKAVDGTLMAKCRKLTDSRRKAIRARLREYGFDGVCQAIQAATHSDFCNGRNDRNWTADFDFVMNTNKMARLLENKYNTVYGTGTIQTGGQRPTAEDIIRDVQIRHILSAPQPNVGGAEGNGEGVQRGFPFD